MSRPNGVLWMPDGGWKFLVIALLLAPLLNTPCEGQLMFSALSVTARPFDAGMDCSTAPLFCEGRSSYLELGTYEFDIQLMDIEEISAARFSLTWPPDWTLLEWSNCSSATIYGDVTVNGAGILMTFDGCLIVGETVLRMVFDCTTPGRFAMEDHPTEGEAAVLPCDWYYGDEWYGEYNWWPHVEIGDYCGRAPESPCSICDSGGLVGRFGPNQTSFDLELGQSVMDTIVVYAPLLCWNIPECSTLPSPCYWRTEANVGWISLRALDSTDDYTHPIERTVTSEGLDPGSYSGRIVIGGYSGDCCGESNCEEITLTVTDPNPIEWISWGLMKMKSYPPREDSEPDKSSAQAPPSEKHQ